MVEVFTGLLVYAVANGFCGIDWASSSDGDYGIDCGIVLYCCGSFIELCDWSMLSDVREGSCMMR